MRNFLVTKFVCSECGRPLELQSKAGISARVPYVEGEPTGALMVDQAVTIVPCKCVTGKLNDLCNAAKTMFYAVSKMSSGEKDNG